MEILITIKTISNKMNYITDKPYKINEDINTLKNLLIALVCKEVAEFNSRDKLSYLTEGQSRSKEKISFTKKYNSKVVEKEEAIKTMVMGFKDGLFKVFLNDREIENLNDSITLKNRDHLVLIRFTMLSGGIW